jgi:hypothetical protein
MREGKRESVPVIVDLPADDGGAPGLKAMWARARTEELMLQQHDGEKPEIVREITTLGLEYHLVTSYTSLVAADDQRVTATQGQTVAVATTPVSGADVNGVENRRVNTTPFTRSNSSDADAPARGFATPEPPVRSSANLQLDNFKARPVTPPAHARVEYFQTPDGQIHPNVLPAREDDDFNAAFGGGASDDKPGFTKTSRSDRTVYIPPAPGSAGEIKDSLGQSDIMEVVKRNVPAIQACVAKQREKQPGLSGKIVMKWTILTSGKTALILVVSDELKDTYLASCLSSLIKTWQFPRTKTQGDPVIFPFKF